MDRYYDMAVMGLTRKTDSPKKQVSPRRKGGNIDLKTSLDQEFDALMAFVGARSFTQMCDAVKQNLRYFEGKEKHNYTATVNYYNKYKMWGELHPDIGVWELVENRAQAFTEHREDFIWLYGKLADYRSKRVLYNILSFWLSCDYQKTDLLKDKYFGQYFDLDLIRCDKNEVLVDIGAYIGDTMVDYTNTYGKDCYKRIYCYEIVPENVGYIHKNIELFHLSNIVVRACGASDRAGTLYLPDAAASSVKTLSETGNVAVPTVTIDDDIDEPVTFIKMDIEGAEEQALLGCRKKIAESHPKLALAAYHNHKDMWRLARIIDETDPTYKFYLRYYGNPLLPTEYVLYAV